jgi:hypothetical protein
VASEPGAEASRKPATRTCDESSSKLHGAIVVPPCIWYGLRRRQESISEEAKEIAWKAQHRLHKRYLKLGAAGKDHRKIVTAVARELLGFVWAVGTRAETIVSQRVTT